MICCRSSNICRICTSSAPLTPRILSSCRRRLGEPLPTRQTSTPRGVDFLDLSFQNSTCLCLVFSRAILQRTSHFTRRESNTYNARAILQGAKQMHLPGGEWEEARPGGSWPPLQDAGSRRNTAEGSVDSQKIAGCLPRLTMANIYLPILVFGTQNTLTSNCPHTPLAALTSLGSAAVHNK
jgi:hypothetical protein